MIRYFQDSRKKKKKKNMSSLKDDSNHAVSKVELWKICWSVKKFNDRSKINKDNLNYVIFRLQPGRVVTLVDDKEVSHYFYDGVHKNKIKTRQ